MIRVVGERHLHPQDGDAALFMPDGAFGGLQQRQAAAVVHQTAGKAHHPRHFLGDPRVAVPAALIAAEGDFARAAERRGDFGGYYRVWIRCVRRNSSLIIYIAQQGGKAADQRAKQRHASASILSKRTSA